MSITNQTFTSPKLIKIISGSCACCNSNNTHEFSKEDDEVYFFCEDCFKVASVSSNAHGDKGDAWLHIYKKGKEIKSSEQFVDEFDYTLRDEEDEEES